MIDRDIEDGDPLLDQLNPTDEGAEKIYRWAKDEDHELTHVLTIITYSDENGEKGEEGVRFLFARLGDYGYKVDWPVDHSEVPLRLLPADEMLGLAEELLWVAISRGQASGEMVELVEGDDDEYGITEELQERADQINNYS